ncbi:MAG: hypothetical protein U0136_06175 [Bdellovibrionota bacterium]
MISNARRWLSVATLLFGCGCREEILHDLDELHANQVQLVLNHAGIESEKVRSGALWNVTVSRSRSAGALSSLEQSRVLWRDLSRFKEQSGGFIQSREERARESERQVSWTMEQTLERLPGVLEARVQLEIADQSADLSAAHQPRSGSVLLVVNELKAPDVHEVKQLVAGGTGLSPEAISVVVAQPPKEARPMLRHEGGESPPLTESRGGERKWELAVRLGLLGSVGMVFVLLLAWLRLRRRKKAERLRPAHNGTRVRTSASIALRPDQNGDEVF